jgi:hypothetical protein
VAAAAALLLLLQLATAATMLLLPPLLPVLKAGPKSSADERQVEVLLEVMLPNVMLLLLL